MVKEQATKRSLTTGKPKKSNLKRLDLEKNNASIFIITTREENKTKQNTARSKSKGPLTEKSKAT